MAQLSIYLSDAAKADLTTRARSEGITVGALVKRALELDDAGMTDQLVDHERRLAELERIAGL